MSSLAGHRSGGPRPDITAPPLVRSSSFGRPAHIAGSGAVGIVVNRVVMCAKDWRTADPAVVGAQLDQRVFQGADQQLDLERATTFVGLSLLWVVALPCD
jgi:hypothetical protein